MNIITRNFDLSPRYDCSCKQRSLTWPNLRSITNPFIDIRCFSHDPSIKSSLTFLRRMPWARKQVEDFYIAYGHDEWLKDHADSKR